MALRTKFEKTLLGVGFEPMTLGVLTLLTHLRLMIFENSSNYDRQIKCNLSHLRQLLFKLSPTMVDNLNTIRRFTATKAVNSLFRRAIKDFGSTTCPL